MNVDSKAARLNACTHRNGKALVHVRTETVGPVTIQHYKCKDCDKAINMREIARPPLSRPEVQS